MNSSDLTVWVAQGSKEKKSIEYFLTTFEGGFFSTFYWQKIGIHIVASALKSCIISIL
jgi:hypothetical protein